MCHPVPPNGVAPTLIPTPQAGAMNAGAMNAGAMNCAPTGSDAVGARFIAPAAGSPSPRRRGGWGVRSLLPLALVVALLFGRPAYGQGGFVTPGDLPYGPVGTIAAPHGAGVVL